MLNTPLNRHVYDPAHNLQWRTHRGWVQNFKVDRLNHWTSASYDNYGFLAFVTNALNKTVSFGYCSCGLLESTIDELGQTTAFHYKRKYKGTGQ